MIMLRGSPSSYTSSTPTLITPYGSGRGTPEEEKELALLEHWEKMQMGQQSQPGGGMDAPAYGHTQAEEAPPMPVGEHAGGWPTAPLGHEPNDHAYGANEPPARPWQPGHHEGPAWSGGGETSAPSLPSVPRGQAASSDQRPRPSPRAETSHDEAGSPLGRRPVITPGAVYEDEEPHTSVISGGATHAGQASKTMAQSSTPAALPPSPSGQSPASQTPPATGPESGGPAGQQTSRPQPMKGKNTQPG